MLNSVCYIAKHETIYYYVEESPSQFKNATNKICLQIVYTFNIHVCGGFGIK